MSNVQRGGGGASVVFYPNPSPGGGTYLVPARNAPSHLTAPPPRTSLVNAVHLDLAGITGSNQQAPWIETRRGYSLPPMISTWAKAQGDSGYWGAPC